MIRRFSGLHIQGSGKTTLLSLICSDHPQTYALPIEIFGQSRLPKPGKPGISIFDIQARIGHSSPEIHAFFPRHLTVRQTLESAWAETFLGKPQLSHECDSDVDACLRWFRSELSSAFSTCPEETRNEILRLTKHDKPELRQKRTKGLTMEMQFELERLEGADLDWADELRFGEMSFSAQRVALFIRAIIKKPDLVMLDEAFSGMDSCVRDKCLLFLAYGQERRLASNDSGTEMVMIPTPYKHLWVGESRFSGLSKEQALVSISHVKEEVPDVLREWICLPEANTGEPPRSGRLGTPLRFNWNKWNGIWGI